MLRRLLVICLAGALLLGQASAAAACSSGPDHDARGLTHVMVYGRARAIELGGPTIAGFVEATVTLDVIQVLRGTAPSSLRYVDPTSAALLRDPRTGREELTFAGGSGACGTLDDDPVGQYVLIALARGQDGRFHANRLFGAIYAAHPDPAMYRWLLARHGVADPFVVGSPAPDVGAFGPMLVP
jgi:hypothetical protein